MANRPRTKRTGRGADQDPQHPASQRPLAPLYYRVFRTLEQRIRDHYKPDERLPSEDQLCREFKASRITIREAVGRLVELGLVSRRRGSGTFVSRRAARAGSGEPVKFSAALEDLFAQVETVRTKSVHVGEESAPADIQAALGLEQGARVTVVHRVRLYRDQVFAVTVNYLPKHLGERLVERDLYRYPLLQLLEEKQNVVFRYADQTMEARLADEDVAKALGIHFGDPVLFAERLMYVEDNRPFEVVRSYYRADVYQYHVRLERSQQAPFNWRVTGGTR